MEPARIERREQLHRIGRLQVEQRVGDRAEIAEREQPAGCIASPLLNVAPRHLPSVEQQQQPASIGGMTSTPPTSPWVKPRCVASGSHGTQPKKRRCRACWRRGSARRGPCGSGLQAGLAERPAGERMGEIVHAICRSFPRRRPTSTRTASAAESAASTVSGIVQCAPCTRVRSCWERRADRLIRMDVGLDRELIDALGQPLLLLPLDRDCEPPMGHKQPPPTPIAQRCGTQRRRVSRSRSAQCARRRRRRQVKISSNKPQGAPRTERSPSPRRR